MARPLRIEYPGAVYHITTRGNAGQTVFLDDHDRAAFLSTYAEVGLRMQWRCYAYCLMDDHYHIVIETPKPNLSKGMRQLNGVYTQRFNQRHNRSGHLFQGRYKAIVVERSRYLMDVRRHVVLNPVRMGMARKASSWKWSSYRATAGLEKSPAWLETDWILKQLSAQRARAQTAYERFVQQGKNLSPWEDIRHQIYLGGDGFIRRLQAKPKLTIRKHRPGKIAMQKLTQLKRRAHDPKRAMAVAYLSGRYTLNEIAQQFDVHYSTVSRAVKDYEKRE